MTNILEANSANPPTYSPLNTMFHNQISKYNSIAASSSNDSRVVAYSPVKNALGEKLKTSNNTPMVKLLAGMAGGVAEAVCLQPLDVTKTRLQLDKKGEYRGMFHCLKTIAKTEGTSALYKGLTPFVTHLTLKYAVRFGMFEYIKNILNGGNPNNASAGINFSAGLIVGCLEATMIVTPFEVVKTRLQSQHGTTNLRYKGPIDVLVKVIREEGVKRMWSGNVPTVIRQGSNQAFNFMSMSILNKQLWGKEQGDGKTLPVWQTLLSGLLAGAVGPCFNCPVDVIKTRMMAQTYENNKEVKYKNWHQAARLIAAEEGTAALWKGLIPRLTRLAPGQAITWTVVMRVTSYFEAAEVQAEKDTAFDKKA